MQTKFHWLTLGLALGIIGLYWALLAGVGHYWLVLGVRVWSTSLFRYQHVGILNTKFLRLGSRPMQGPNAKGFALRWNIGLSSIETKIISFLLRKAAILIFNS